VYYFFRQELGAAREHFSAAASLLPKLKPGSIFCNIPPEELEGYSTACGLDTPTQLSLLCQFHAAIRQQYTVSDQTFGDTFIPKLEFPSSCVTSSFHLFIMRRNEM